MKFKCVAHVALLSLRLVEEGGPDQRNHRLI